MNKTTVLVYINPNAPEQGLRVATQKEWSEILKKNASLPREQRRLFIEDVIHDDGIDRMYIESSREDYAKWHSEQTERSRQFQLKKELKFYSLDVTVNKAEGLTYADIVVDPSNMEEGVLDAMLIEQLRKALSEKWSWGSEMLDCYLDGRIKGLTRMMAQNGGVTPKTIASRKRQFEAFVKKFLSEG